MKPASQVTACFIDQGYYISTAEALARTFKKVYYSSPCDREFQCASDCVYGDGLDTIERTDNFLEPELLKEIDLFVFPEIGFASLQKHLRSLGKAVWGSFDATYLEMYRTQFLDFVREAGLPVPPSRTITGVSNLRDYLKDKSDKWVKLDRFRGDCETFHWIDSDYGEAKMNELSTKFGGVKELVGFVVQDPIKAVAEIGYDGWTVDGRYPGSSFYGVEGKNEIYLGTVRQYSQLPKEIREVNSAIAPKLKELGYRNFMASEIRVGEDKKPYYIDPTFRQAGQTCEQLQETCANLADVIWHGANGELLEPKWNYKFAASATMHYDACVDGHWKTLRVPKEVKQWVKAAHYCEVDGVLQFPPSPSDELGVVIGCGNSITETLAHLRKNIDALGDAPVSFQLDGFHDLLDDIREAQKKGMKFTEGAIPKREDILKYIV